MEKLPRYVCAEAAGGFAMDDYDVYDDPQYWRDRAFEARTNATYIRDPETRDTMLGIADQFERLARLAEQRGQRPIRTIRR